MVMWETSNTPACSLFFLRAVMQRHVPAAEIDDARAGGGVLIKEWRFQGHLGSRVKKTGRQTSRPAAPLSSKT
jgi:hypothetical protein